MGLQTRCVTSYHGSWEYAAANVQCIAPTLALPSRTLLDITPGLKRFVKTLVHQPQSAVIQTLRVVQKRIVTSTNRQQISAQPAGFAADALPAQPAIITPYQNVRRHVEYVHQ